MAANCTGLRTLNLMFCNKLYGTVASIAYLSVLKSLKLSSCHGLDGSVMPLASCLSLTSLDLTNTPYLEDKEKLETASRRTLSARCRVMI